MRLTCLHLALGSPTEFERDAHYLKDDHGDDVESLFSLVPAPPIVTIEQVTFPKPWGASIGSAFVINIVTLIGVIIWALTQSRVRSLDETGFEAYVQAFSAGEIDTPMAVALRPCPATSGPVATTH